MNEKTGPNDNPPPEAATPHIPPAKRSFWLPIIALLVVFLAGLVPMWLKSHRLAGELYQARQELRRTQIQLVLAYSALDARRGEYEAARQGQLFQPGHGRTRPRPGLDIAARCPGWVAAAVGAA